MTGSIIINTAWCLRQCSSLLFHIPFRRTNIRRLTRWSYLLTTCSHALIPQLAHRKLHFYFTILSDGTNYNLPCHAHCLSFITTHLTYDGYIRRCWYFVDSHLFSNLMIKIYSSLHTIPHFGTLLLHSLAIYNYTIVHNDFFIIIDYMSLFGRCIPRRFSFHYYRRLWLVLNFLKSSLSERHTIISWALLLTAALLLYYMLWYLVIGLVIIS
jgi:hypothetical protein